MSFTRIKLSKESTKRLSLLKGKTGLTPNILSRIAFCLSLNEYGLPNTALYDEDGKEFNRYTLTGEWDILFISLLKEQLIKDGINTSTDLLPYFKAHLNRGVSTLYNRVRSLADLYDLLPKEVKRK